jgi:hypothetical protein
MKFNIRAFSKSQISLKSHKSNRYCTRNLVHFYDSLSLKLRNESDESFSENYHTHFVFNNIFAKIVAFMTQCEMFGTAKKARDDNKIKVHVLCVPKN